MTNGETSNAEFLQLHPNLEYPADLAGCATGVVQQFDFSGARLDGRIEERYLRNVRAEEDTAPSDISLVAGVADALHKSKLFDIDPSALTDVENLERILVERRETHQTWPDPLFARAKELDLDIDIDTLGPVGDVSLKSGWQIDFGNSYDPSPRLVVRTIKDGRYLKQTLRLDAIHAKDPVFLKEHIRAYRAQAVVSDLAAKILKARNIHEISLTTAMPEFMQEIMFLPPSERRRAVQDIVDFLTHPSSKSERFTTQAFSMISKGNLLELEDQLHHMSSCPSQPIAIRENNSELQRFSQGLRNTFRYVGQQQPELLMDSFLARPELLIPAYTDEYEQKMHQAMIEIEPMIDFLRAAHETPDLPAMLALLQEKLPETFAGYMRLQEALRPQDGIMHDDGLERTLKDAAHLVLNSPTGTIRPSKLRKELLDKLPVFRIPSEDRPDIGIKIGLLRETQITKPFLETVLALAVCKRAEQIFQESAAAGAIHVDILPHRELEADLLAEYENEMAWRKRALKINDSYRIAAAEFRTAHNISDADIEWLSRTGVRVNEQHNAFVLETVFRALVADRQGILQLNRPSFVAFLRYFLHDADTVPERTQALLDRLFPD